MSVGKVVSDVVMAVGPTAFNAGSTYVASHGVAATLSTVAGAATSTASAVGAAATVAAGAVVAVAGPVLFGAAIGYGIYKIFKD